MPHLLGTVSPMRTSAVVSSRAFEKVFVSAIVNETQKRLTTCALQQMTLFLRLSVQTGTMSSISCYHSTGTEYIIYDPVHIVI